MITSRLNAPHPQSGPVLVIGVGLVGSWYVTGEMANLPVASEPWWAGFLIQSTTVVCLLTLLGAWLWMQREVAVGPNDIQVRRWIEVLRGLPGTRVEIGPETVASIKFDTTRFLVLQQGDHPVLSVPLNIWEADAQRELIDALRECRVPLAQYWDGKYPHDLT